jgi:hypothetical protein
MKDNEGFLESHPSEDRHETEVNQDIEKLNYFRSSTGVNTRCIQTISEFSEREHHQNGGDYSSSMLNIRRKIERDLEDY